MSIAKDTDQAHDSPSPVRRDPELVFALGSPIDTPIDDFRDAFCGGLMAYGYTVELIKLSKLLLDQAASKGMKVRKSPENDRVSDLMDGNIPGHVR